MTQITPTDKGVTMGIIPAAFVAAIILGLALFVAALTYGRCER